MRYWWHQLDHTQIRSRQITTPAPHHSFCWPSALPNAQPTVSKHWRHLIQLCVCTALRRVCVDDDNLVLTDVSCSQRQARHWMASWLLSHTDSVACTWLCSLHPHGWSLSQFQSFQKPIRTLQTLPMSSTISTSMYCYKLMYLKKV